MLTINKANKEAADEARQDETKHEDEPWMKWARFVFVAFSRFLFYFISTLFSLECLGLF